MEQPQAKQIHKSTLFSTLSDSAIYAAGNVSVAAIGIIALPILTRVLKPEVYGQYIIIYQIVYIFMTLIAGWTGNAYLRYFPSSTDRRGLLTTNLVGVLASSLLFSLPAVYSASILFKGEDVAFPGSLGFVIVLLLWFFSLLQFYNFVLRARGEPGWFSFANIMNTAGRFIGGAFVAYLLQSYELIAMLITWGLTIIALDVFFLIRDYKQIFRLEFSLPGLKAALLFGFPLSINLLLSGLLDSGDRFLLQFFLGSSEVAIYDISYRLAKFPLTLVGSSFMLAAYPNLVVIWDKFGKKQTEFEVSKLIRYVVMIMVMVIISMSMLSREIVTQLLDESFESGYIAIPLVATGVFFLMLSQYSTIVFLLQKQSYRYLLLNLFGVVLNLVLNLLLITRLGFVGAAVSTLLSYFLFFVISRLITKQQLNWHIPLSSLFRIGISGIVSVISIIIVRQLVQNSSVAEIIALFLTLLAGATAYIVTLIISGEVSYTELRVLVNLLSRRSSSPPA